MEAPHSPESRQKLLEEQLAYQQHQLDELNQALVLQSEELDKLRQDLTGLISVIRNLIENSGTDLPHEKPPHY